MVARLFLLVEVQLLPTFAYDVSQRLVRGSKGDNVFLEIVWL